MLLQQLFPGQVLRVEIGFVVFQAMSEAVRAEGGKIEMVQRYDAHGDPSIHFPDFAIRRRNPVDEKPLL